jgi:N-acetylated-alpha-linked acidic dipeptidase
MTPSLLDLVKSAANDITDPVQIASTWTSEPGRLGSGSDYTVFLDHLGIPSVDMSFVISDDAPYGVYHSVYDSFSWMTRFGDPDFTYHQAMTQMWGLMALRLSDADLLPFNYVRYADELRKYIDELDVCLLTFLC